MYDDCLTIERWAGKATIKLQLTLGDQQQPRLSCQVGPQPRRPGPSCLRCRERRAETHTVAANADDATEANASEATETRSPLVTWYLVSH